jgi:hypothetical protein
MAMGRPKAAVVLRSEQREQLEGMASSRSLPAGLVSRARIILLSASGKTNLQIARQMGLTNATVGKWRRRFLEQEVSGLHDELRPGRPRPISDERVARLVKRPSYFPCSGSSVAKVEHLEKGENPRFVVTSLSGASWPAQALYCCAGSACWAKAQCSTIRLKLLKIGALIRITVRKVWVSLAGGYHYVALFRQVYEKLCAVPVKH